MLQSELVSAPATEPGPERQSVVRPEIVAFADFGVDPTSVTLGPPDEDALHGQWSPVDVPPPTYTLKAKATYPLGDGRAVRLALGAPVASDPVALDDWRRRDVEARLPLLPSVLAGEFTPQALGLEAIDAIRFDKGCYPGQEVAARLHFRGGNKRRLVAASTDAAAACGDDLLDDRGGLAGRVLYPAAGAQRLLAVVVEDAPSALRTRAGETVRLD